MAGLVFDKAGNLYGTTSAGGSSNDGTVFKLVPNGNGTWTENVIHSFNGKDGSAPYGAGVIFDAAGNLYGTTSAGGSNNNGTIFKLAPNGDGTWTETVLHSFGVLAKDGIAPYAGLVMDTAGNLYGTASAGGATGHGTVFEITP